MNKAVRAAYPAHVRSVSEQNGGVYQNRCLVTCVACGKIRSWPRFPAALTAKFLEQRGYRDPLSTRSITCPQCVATEKETAVRVEPDDQKRKMTRKQAAYLALNKPKPKEAVVAESASIIPIASVLKADEPRTATREDNRRISDYLESVYDGKKECYRATGSDQVVADFLKVPRAWVAAVRDLTFGPDVNEVRKSAPARLAILESRLKEHEDRLLTYAAEVEADRKAVAAMRADLAVLA